MKPYNSHEKKALFYAIQDTDGSPLDLMNIQTYKDGLLAAVTTFIGRHDRDEFVKVAETEDLSSTVFNYSRFVQQQERFSGRIYPHLSHQSGRKGVHRVQCALC